MRPPRRRGAGARRSWTRTTRRRRSWRAGDGGGAGVSGRRMRISGAGRRLPARLRRSEAGSDGAHARALGVPKRVLSWEDQSRDTMENCCNAAALLGGTGRVLVVTSDITLRRAVMTARRAGLRADGLAAKTTGGRVGKRLMEACYIADSLLGWQDEGRARPRGDIPPVCAGVRRTGKKIKRDEANCRLHIDRGRHAWYNKNN